MAADTLSLDAAMNSKQTIFRLPVSINQYNILGTFSGGPFFGLVPWHSRDAGFACHDGGFMAEGSLDFMRRLGLDQESRDVKSGYAAEYLEWICKSEPNTSSPFRFERSKQSTNAPVIPPIFDIIAASYLHVLS